MTKASPSQYWTQYQYHPAIGFVYLVQGLVRHINIQDTFLPCTGSVLIWYGTINTYKYQPVWQTIYLTLLVSIYNLLPPTSICVLETNVPAVLNVDEKNILFEFSILHSFKHTITKLLYYPKFLNPCNKPWKGT